MYAYTHTLSLHKRWAEAWSYQISAYDKELWGIDSATMANKLLPPPNIGVALQNDYEYDRHDLIIR